jgi:hypothetical protein
VASVLKISAKTGAAAEYANKVKKRQWAKMSTKLFDNRNRSTPFRLLDKD